MFINKYKEICLEYYKKIIVFMTICMSTNLCLNVYIVYLMMTLSQNRSMVVNTIIFLYLILDVKFFIFYIHFYLYIFNII